MCGAEDDIQTQATPRLEPPKIGVPFRPKALGLLPPHMCRAKHTLDFSYCVRIRSRLRSNPYSTPPPPRPINSN